MWGSVAAGVMTGLSYGIAAEDVTGKLGAVLEVATAQLPVIWMLVAITVGLFGVLPPILPCGMGSIHCLRRSVLFRFHR